MKYSEENYVFGEVSQSFFWGWEGVEGGVGGCLLTFSAVRMGIYSRWTLIQGWALIRINTVS